MLELVRIQRRMFRCLVCGCRVPSKLHEVLLLLLLLLLNYTTIDSSGAYPVHVQGPLQAA
jgi:hypothetical protein